jgi:hypothetical protein
MSCRCPVWRPRRCRKAGRPPRRTCVATCRRPGPPQITISIPPVISAAQDLPNMSYCVTTVPRACSVPASCWSLNPKRPAPGTIKPGLSARKARGYVARPTELRKAPPLSRNYPGTHSSPLVRQPEHIQRAVLCKRIDGVVINVGHEPRLRVEEGVGALVVAQEVVGPERPLLRPASGTGPENRFELIFLSISSPRIPTEGTPPGTARRTSSS